jgi:UDP-N-acetylmuramate: L-alanyl-gamma-D-glutamyl-meso-diaminopimelate ligase
MKIHLIAIGGAVMHNLALALHENGHEVTGSDDEIFEPSKSRLQAKNMLPGEEGWHISRIHSGLDAVILGMHARSDNPELIRAQELGLPIYSFPEFVWNQSVDKLRVAICGSHGKTTITSMVMHALKKANQRFDYLVGAQLAGFQTMVQFSDAPTMIIEGDEYFASALKREPKFLFYLSQITLISGIAWDHFNVFPTLDNYHDQFLQLINQKQQGEILIINGEDPDLIQLVQNSHTTAQVILYTAFSYTTNSHEVIIQHDNKDYPIQIFGKHNISNLAGAATICAQLDIPVHDFLQYMSDFQGASKRLECIGRNDSRIIYRDFAHAPSKVKATTNAIREMFPDKKITACLELHTFSSLNKSFLPNYHHALMGVDYKIVYYNPHTLSMKQLPPIEESELKTFFGDSEIVVMTDSRELQSALAQNTSDIILLMSSGNFDNLNFDQLI